MRARLEKKTECARRGYVRIHRLGTDALVPQRAADMDIFQPLGPECVHIHRDAPKTDPPGGGHETCE
eukprot:2842340-Pyramimonas_sp.AAC.1